MVEYLTLAHNTARASRGQWHGGNTEAGLEYKEEANENSAKKNHGSALGRVQL